MEKFIVKMVNTEKKFGFTTNGVHFSLRYSLEAPRIGNVIYGEKSIQKGKGPTLGSRWWSEAEYLNQERERREKTKRDAEYEAEQLKKHEVLEEFAHIRTHMRELNKQIAAETGQQYEIEWSIIGAALWHYESYIARGGEEALYWRRYGESKPHHFDIDGLPDIEEELERAKEYKRLERESHQAEHDVCKTIGFSQPFPISSPWYGKELYRAGCCFGEPGKIFVRYYIKKNDANQEDGYLLNAAEIEMVECIINIADGGWEGHAAEIAKKFRDDLLSERVVILAKMVEGGSYISNDGRSARSFPDHTYYDVITKDMLKTY